MSSSANKGPASASRRGEGGYTLLEFLAAFTLFTLFLAAAFAALAVAMRADHQATFLTMATTLAKSKLAAAGADFPLRPGATGGEFGNGYVWRAVVRQYAAVGQGRDQAAVYWVEVTVSDGRSSGGRSLSLASLEMSDELRR